MPRRFAGELVGLRLGESEQADDRVFLGAILRHDVEEIEQQAVAVVAGDERAAPLLPDEHVFGDQFVDRPAHGADADAVAFRQAPLGGDGVARLPFAAGQRLHQLPLDLAVQRRR